MARAKSHDSRWLSQKPISVLRTYAENALWSLNRLRTYENPNSEFFAYKADEYDFLFGQLELKSE